MTFQEKLNNIIKKNNSLVCVGLDSDFDKLPENIKQKENPQFEFNKAIIDATHEFACCYKPNSAFYEARGEQGIHELKMTFDYINSTYSDVTTILDAKRADIGNTNNGYVTFAFDWLAADAITLHPYLGKEALGPFLDRMEKGSIILCHTTNPGAEELQDLTINEKPFYQIVAAKVINEWNGNTNCLLVLGAKFPEQLAAVRNMTADMTFLVPGIGAQGGDLEETLKAGLNAQKRGLIINSSRGIIFASSDEDFADRAKEETKKLRDEINKYR